VLGADCIAEEFPMYTKKNLVTTNSSSGETQILPFFRISLFSQM